MQAPADPFFLGKGSLCKHSGLLQSGPGSPVVSPENYMCARPTRAHPQHRQRFIVPTSPTLDLVQDNPPPSMPKPAKRHHTDQTRQEHRRQKCHKPMGSVPCKNGPGAGVAYQCPAPAIAALLSAPLPSPISRETKRQKDEKKLTQNPQCRRSSPAKFPSSPAH